MTTRTLLPVLASVLLLAGCGGSSTPAESTSVGTPSAAASAAAASPASSAAPGGAAAASTSGAAPVGSTGGATTGDAPAGTTTTGTATNSGGTGPKYTAAGTYTYDTSGTVTAGTPRDASGTATLTVDPPAGGRQHSLLGTDQGRTEQDVVVRSDGVYLVRLAITNPAFSKEFRPTSGILVPEPPTTGRSWSWTARSTDGKTTATVTARITGRETLTIGGESTPTIVIQSTLKLTGDITYSGHMQTWVDPTHRLSVKEHTKGEGTVGGVPFSTDITNVIRSTRPS